MWFFIVVGGGSELFNFNFCSILLFIVVVFCLSFELKFCGKYIFSRLLDVINCCCNFVVLSCCLEMLKELDLCSNVISELDWLFLLLLEISNFMWFFEISLKVEFWMMEMINMRIIGIRNISNKFILLVSNCFNFFCIFVLNIFIGFCSFFLLDE